VIRKMPSCNAYFGKIFAHLTAATAIAGLSAEYTDIGNKIIQTQNVWIKLIANAAISLVLLFGIFLTPAGSILKYLFFGSFAFWIGQTVKPLVDKLKDKNALQHTIFLATGVFAAMTAVGFFDKQNLLGFGPYLLFGLLGLVIAEIVLMFVDESKFVFDLVRFFGLTIFSALTAYDVQLLKENAKFCRALKNAGKDPDYPKESLGLFLDLVNLFSYIADTD
jgi:FtsH-binding integral membrane protein